MVKIVTEEVVRSANLLQQKLGAPTIADTQETGSPLWCPGTSARQIHRKLGARV